MTDHSPRRALVVEDDPSWQQILKEILVDCGLDVVAASNLPDALSLASEGQYNLAVVDLSLEGADPHNHTGFQVLEAIKSVNPSCQSILLTGFATVELAVSAITEHGAHTCLRKETFQRGGFRQLVGQLLQSSHSGSVSAAEAGEGTTLASTVGDQSQVVPIASFYPVLVVEDDPGWQNILSELLHEAAQDIRLCSGFGEALGKLRREKYSLAVVDLSLLESNGGLQSSGGRGGWNPPDFSGFRLLASARAAGIPTIVVSGVSIPEEIERAYEEYGIFAYLQKQVFNRKAFLITVSEAISTHQKPDELAGLTDRERQVFDLLAKGMTNKEIADALVISTNTVKRHLKAIFGKLHIHTRSAAASKSK